MKNKITSEWLGQNLETLQHLPGVIVASRSYCIQEIAVDLPILVIVLRGEKHMRWNDSVWTCRPGQYLMVHRPARITMDAVPIVSGEPYQAWGLAFPYRVVDVARSLLVHRPPAKVPEPEPLITSGTVEGLWRVLERLLELVSRAGANEPDPEELEYHLLGILVALAKSGQGQFLRAQDPSVSSRIRLLVAENPSHEWSSAHFETKLHMSSATLRRRLAGEGTSLRGVLREARLHHGLALLQTTQMPVKAVASECGYRSVSKFSRGFIQRFGIEPTTVANG